MEQTTYGTTLATRSMEQTIYGTTLATRSMGQAETLAFNFQGAFLLTLTSSFGTLTMFNINQHYNNIYMIEIMIEILLQLF